MFQMKNEIKLFWHCAHCVREKPKHKSPQEWGSIEAGWTVRGFQVWCKRHDVNIMNVDLKGNKCHEIAPNLNFENEQK